MSNKIFVKHKLPQAVTNLPGQKKVVKNQKVVEVVKTPEVIAFLNGGRLVEVPAPASVDETKATNAGTPPTGETGGEDTAGKDAKPEGGAENTGETKGEATDAGATTATATGEAAKAGTGEKDAKDKGDQGQGAKNKEEGGKDNKGHGNQKSGGK